MWSELIITALSSGALSSYITWAQTKRKNVAEAQTNEIDNLDKALGYYREIIEDMRKRHADDIDVMKQTLSRFELQIKVLEKENKALHVEMKNYKTKVSELEKKYNELKKSK